MDRASLARRNIAGLTAALVVAAALYVGRLQSYLLFHALVEILTITLACSVFLVTWNAREFEENGYFLFVGIGGLFSAGFAVVHLLAYRGMGVLPEVSTDLPTQLWITGRGIMAATLVIAPRYAGRMLDHRYALAGFAIAAALLAGTIAAGRFPACYVEGIGLTPFKIYAEYGICAGFFGSAALLLRKRGRFAPGVLAYSVAAIVASVLAEVCFTLYRADVYGWFNMVGHYFALAAFYFIYEAVVGTELVRKYALHEKLSEELRERERAEETVRRLASFPLLNPSPVLEIDSSGRIVFLNPATERVLVELGLPPGDARPLLPEPGDALFAEAAASPDVPIHREVAVGGRHFALTVKRAAPFDVVRIYGLEITRRVQAAAKTRQKTAIIQGINRIFREALACRTDEDLGRICLSVAAELTASRFGFIGELGPDGLLHDLAISDPGWELCAMHDRTGHRRPPGSFPITGLYGRVLTDGRSLIANDPATHPDSAGTPPGHPALTAFLGAPLIHGGQTVGMVGLANRDGGYRAEDTEAVEALCGAIVQVLMERRATEALDAAHRAGAIEKRRLEAAMEAVPIGLAILDSQGGAITANDAFERIWGAPRPEPRSVEGYDVYKAWWVETGERVRPGEWASAHAVRNGATVVGQLLRIARFDGTQAYVVNSAAPIRDTDGRIEGSVVAIMDITDRVEAEEALRAAKEGLEARVAERTAELTRINEALRKEVDARRSAEESLGRTAEFLRTVEMSMRAGVSVVDLEGRYIYVNPAFCRIVGWREEELLGKGPPYPFWPPGDVEWLRRIHEAAMRGDSPRGGSEVRYRRRTGERFDALTLPSPLLDDRGRVTGRMTVVYDITERKTAERELLEANEKLNTLIESSPLAIVVRGLDDLVTVWNPAAERMFGWRKEEVLGRPMPIIPPESADEYRKLRDGILRGEELHRIEYRRVGKDGSAVDVSISTALLRDAAGSVNGIMAIFEDVTERKRIQEELKESEIRFRSFVENSPAGLCLVRGGRIFFTNPEMERLFGPIPPGIEFRHYKGVHPDDREKFEQLCAVLERPDPPVLEVDIRFYAAGKGARHEMHWVHVRTNPFDYHGGKATLVSLVDITRFKELEHIARTREKMASLGHVAAGIAHEIRNPLSGLNIFMSNLGKVCEASDGFEAENKELVRNVLEQMKSASVKIESVIRRVMDFTRPHPVKLVPVDVNSAVEEAVALSQVFLRKQGVRVTEALDAALPRVQADLPMIEQVILNLLTNAAQAMEKQPGRREIEIASFRDGDSVIISVSDSGPGVPVEIREKIFDPFYTTRSDGSGIGLSICHRVVSDHGGVLSVRTGKWGGAEFRVALPLGRGSGS